MKETEKRRCLFSFAFLFFFLFINGLCIFASFWGAWIGVLQKVLVVLCEIIVHKGMEKAC